MWIITVFEFFWVNLLNYITHNANWVTSLEAVNQMSCSFLPTVSRESVRLGSEASSLIQTSFKSSEQNKKNQSLVLLDLFIGPVRLKRSHSVCFPAEALRVSVCRFEALREDLVTVISCVWIRSTRSGAFLFTTLWFSYKFRFYRSGCQKSSLQECVTPASRHAGVMKQLFRNTAKHSADKKH